MKILKSINNNIVSAYDENEREVVVIGKGIGYKAREGMEIPQHRIEKVFLMRSQNDTERLKELFASLPIKYIELTDEIITYAKKVLNKRLHEGAYITLADHINFAVMRLKQGMNFQNVLLTEVRRFYSQEYAIGKYALELMKKRLAISMPEDEAASIALHIFNAEYDISISGAFHATKLLDRIVEMVTEETRYVMDENNYYCERFITHLKYLTQRIIKKETIPQGDDEFFEIVSLRYPKEMQCSKTIAVYVLQEYDYHLSPEEVSCLTLHIKRIGMQDVYSDLTNHE